MSSMKLYAILEESFSVNESDLEDGTVIMDLEEWDSMAHMFFITNLEEQYEVDFSGDEIAAMQTVGDVKKHLAEKGKSDA